MDYTAVFDSGCNRSVVDSILASALGWETVKMNDDVLVVNGRAPRLVTKNSHEVVTNGRQVSIRWEIQKLHGVDFLIGTDMMKDLGIYINGIIEPECGSSDVIEIEKEISPNNHTKVKMNRIGELKDELNHNIVKSKLSETLSNNVATALLPCTAPGSLVNIELKVGGRDKLKSIRRNWVSKHLNSAFINQIHTWERNGVIVKNYLSGVINSAIGGVTKLGEDGVNVKHRFCLDPNLINDNSVDDQIIVPKVKDIVEWTAGHEFISVIDMKDGFNKFPVNLETSKLLAFTGPNGVQYRYVRAPFGLKQLISTFSRVMAAVLSEFNYATNYVDDIIIVGGRNISEHTDRVRVVIEKLTSYNLTLNTEKSTFAASKVKVLGFIVDKQGSFVDRSKFEKVINWKRPQSGKEVQRLLGFINYFREYIPDYATMTKELEAVRFVKKLIWSDSLEDTFVKLKNHIQEKTNVLSKFDPLLPTFVETDASGLAVGAVLYQVDKEGKRRYIQFFSKLLSGSQQNYGITKKELLAVVLAFRKWREYLFGIRFILVVDHKALVYLREQRELNGMLSRWSDVLFEQLFSIQYKPGSEHLLPDYLSRQVHLKYVCKQVSNYTNDWSLNKHWFRVLENTFGPHDIDLFANTRNAQLQTYASANGEGVGEAFSLSWSDYNSIYANIPFKLINQVLDKVIQDRATMTLVMPVSLGTKWLNRVISLSIDQPVFIPHASDTFLRHGTDLVGRPPWNWTAAFRISGNPDKTKVLVGDQFWTKIGFKPVQLRRVVTEETSHSGELLVSAKVDPLPAQVEHMLKQRAMEIHAHGHVGTQAMIDLLIDEEYDCDMKVLRKICKGIASACIVCAKNTLSRAGYHPSKSVEADLPFDHIVIDLCTMEMSSNGNNYVLVIKDVLTRFVILRAIQSKTQEAVAKELLDVFVTFGFPKIIQSDNGREFKNILLGAWESMGLFEHRKSTPYHPRCNGIVERANSDIIRMLKALCKGKTTAWDQYLGLVQFYKNTITTRSHQSSPFALMFCRKFNKLGDYQQIDVLSDQQKTKAIQDRLRTAKEATAVIFPQIRQTLKEYNRSKQQQHDKHNKLIQRLPVKTKVMVINRNKRKKLDDNFVGPYTVVKVNQGGAYQLMDSTGTMLSRKVAPADIRIVTLPEPHDLSYEIEEILDDRIEHGLQLYLVKWKGYDESFNSWEPVNNFDDFEMIANYHRDKVK